MTGVVAGGIVRVDLAVVMTPSLVGFIVVGFCVSVLIVVTGGGGSCVVVSGGGGGSVVVSGGGGAVVGGGSVVCSGGGATVGSGVGMAVLGGGMLDVINVGEDSGLFVDEEDGPSVTEGDVSEIEVQGRMGFKGAELEEVWSDKSLCLTAFVAQLFLEAVDIYCYTAG
ncbi:hypothetical protein BGZ98_010184 [Dissophora globulifera]|nr:hypothetical protein BGZ98_010184 [Dissophora globulifera]